MEGERREREGERERERWREMEEGRSTPKLSYFTVYERLLRTPCWWNPASFAC